MPIFVYLLFNLIAYLFAIIIIIIPFIFTNIDIFNENIILLNSTAYIIDKHSLYLSKLCKNNLEHIITNKIISEKINKISKHSTYVTSTNNFLYYFLNDTYFSENNNYYYYTPSISNLIISSNNTFNENLYNIYLKELNYINNIYFKYLYKNYNEYFKNTNIKTLNLTNIWGIMFVSYLESDFENIVIKRMNILGNKLNNDCFIKYNYENITSNNIYFYEIIE
jgi:hypothetical protein